MKYFAFSSVMFANGYRKLQVIVLSCIHSTMEDNENIIIENQNELEIEWQEEDQIYPMDGIKVDKGFYTVFELKRRFDSKEKRIILDSCEWVRII